MIDTIGPPFTRIRVPDIRPKSVSRPRLLDALDAGVARGIVSVCAPAGSGKTTLVGQWCRRTPSDGRCAWLSLTEAENDLATFLRSLGASIDIAVPGAGRAALRMTDEAWAKAHRVLVGSLIDELGRTDMPTTLVLDDVHTLTTSDVLLVLANMIEQLPPSVRMILVSRAVPSLPLPRWREHGRLLEIGGDELRLSAAEASRFVHATTTLAVTGAQVERLVSRTDGWIAGLRLALIAAARSENPDAFLSRFSGADPHVQDYLFSDALAGQPEWLVSFLMETAVVQPFCASMCDSIRGISVPPGWPSPSATVLSEIERGNLFLVPLDEQRVWYRYHPLIAEALAARLEAIAPQHSAKLRRRANRWHEANEHAAPPSTPALTTHLTHASAAKAAGVALDLLEPLTRRELDVLRCIARGASNRTVAEQLFISPATAKKHTSNIFAKLGVTSRTQAIVRALEMDLL
ncbi:MAG: LuxR C-terminal-related transcriptional regulator [Ardenticatenales bacterium]